MRTREIDALAVDYDRTLTDPDLELVPEALDALAEARARGKRIVVVSGRDLPFLERELRHVADVLVAENGCLVRGPDGRVEATAERWDLRPCLSKLDLALEYGEILASADVAEAQRLREALEAAGMQADLIPNRDRVMVLPRGVDKAAGIRRALDLLGIPLERAAAAGDGENDVPMLLAVGYGIAVSNAVDELKDVADVVTDKPGGHGVAEWIRRAWLAREVVEA